MKVSRDDVLRYRVHAQQLDRRTTGAGTRSTAARVLDVGVQDTGPDGARWALAVRGYSPPAADLVTAWTLRGAPHVYRRSQAAAVALATSPRSESDAAKRVFDAAKPLKAAGIPVLEALDTIATEMRDIATRPTVKGAMSSELTARMPKPYLRHCAPCDTTHLYEQPFRLSALRAGLELEPGTSPPVLRRIPGWRGLAKRADPALDPVRAVLHLLGPLTPKQVASYVDAPVTDIKDAWPDDVVDVEVDGERRSLLASDEDALTSAADVAEVRHLLGPYDLFLQARDRKLVVPGQSHRRDLWRALGRPGGVLVGHEIVGSWRPRTAGKKLRIEVDAWRTRLPDLTESAERLAAFRGVTFDGFDRP